MIDEIHVCDIALIRDGYIEPSAGMTAITGETGTGKTALLTACRLIMGERAARSLVREGASSAQVEARLFVGAPDFIPESTEGLPSEELVVSRSVASDGRSRVRINGELASVAELNERVAPLIDLCSQHDQQTLLHPAKQRQMLDVWCGNDANGLLDVYQSAYDAVAQAEAELEAIISQSEVSSNRLNDAQIVLREVDSVNPSQEDYDELIATLRISENAEALARLSSEALSALNDEGGALDTLNGASALLDNGAKLDPQLSALSAQIKDALFTAEDVAREIASYQSAIDLDVGELTHMQDRAAAYQALMRSYGPTISDVIAHADEARRVMALANNSDEMEKVARDKLEQAQLALDEAASALSSSRVKGAVRFGDEVTKVMADLEMQKSSLICAVEQLPREKWTQNGADDIAFMFSPDERMQPRQLARIASGGELSRVMLAIHVVMGERDSVPTLVFDEIDAGVGGVTAVALAHVLSRVAATHQVIVVTHLPQIAAHADRHYVVTKLDDASASYAGENVSHDAIQDGLYTAIEEVADKARVHEIARMLSGSITETSLAHAEELLAQAS